MKLCVISPIFPLPGESPSVGPDNVVFNLVKGLVKINADLSIDIITIRTDIKNLFINELFRNVRVHYYPYFKFLPRCLGDPIIIRRIIKKYDFDLIHSHSTASLSLILDSSIPKILTLHGIYWEEKKFIKNRLLRMGFYDYNTFVFKKIFPNIDAFVAISPYVSEELKKMKIFDKNTNIFQISNPIDDSFFTSSSDNQNHNIIFYPAVIRLIKNQKTAIEVTNVIKDEITGLKLILAGSISEPDYFQRIQYEIDNNNLSEVVDYKGKVSRANMLDLYSKSSIVYVLSYHESFCMVVAEAMASGIPVIASNLKSISNLVDDGITGYLVNPNDKRKIAELTLELLKNEDKRLVMGNQAKEIAKKKFNSSIIAKQTLDMYNIILNSKHK